MTDQEQQTFLEYTTLGPPRYSGLAIISFSCAAVSITLFLFLLCITTVTPGSWGVSHYVINEFALLAICMIVMGAVASLFFGIGALAWTSRKLKQPLRGRWMAVVGIVYGAIYGVLILMFVIMFVIMFFFFRGP